MKKMLLPLISIVTVSVLLISSNSYSLNINNAALSVSDERIKSIASEFDGKFDIKKDASSTNDVQLNTEITNLSRKLTYLLLGSPDKTNSNNEDFSLRKKELIDSLRYAPEIPKDASGNIDTNSKEAIDDSFTGLNIPGMFNILGKMNISYQDYGMTKVYKTDDVVYSFNYINNIKQDIPNEKEPRKIDRISTNLKLYYIFKKINNEYKIYYISGETTDDTSNFVDNLADSELSADVSSSKFIPENISSFDYSKLYGLDSSTIKSVYNDNSDSIVKVTFSDSKKSPSYGVGFYVGNGLIATSWSLIDESLKKFEYMSVLDKNNESLDIDGIVTINPDLDIAIIKLKQETGKAVASGDMSSIKKSDPVISISSKSGYGMSAVAGIAATVNDETLESILPSTDNDRGSPIFNTNGEMIGMTVNRPLNSNFSTSINGKYLKRFMDNISKFSFKDINTLTISYLKNKYYFNKIKNESVVNNLTDAQKSELAKIIDYENIIPLDLKLVNYYDGIFSIRYKKDQNSSTNVTSELLMSAHFKSNGYSIAQNSNEKTTLASQSHQVTILDEPEYFIVIINKR